MAAASLCCGREVAPARAAAEPEGNAPVIIFDWDDTLLPTWSMLQLGGQPDTERREAYARLLEATLRAARSLAKVVLVTMSKSPWVSLSADMHLPSLSIDEVLAELEIPVYYARQRTRGPLAVLHKTSWAVELDCRERAHGLAVRPLEGALLLTEVLACDSAAQRWNHRGLNELQAGDRIVSVSVGERRGCSHAETARGGLAQRFEQRAVLRLEVERRRIDSVTPSADAKRSCMAECLEEVYADVAGARWNAISIGDSLAERQALQELMGRDPEAPNRGTCKTLKFHDRPSMEELEQQLRNLLLWLPRLVEHRSDTHHDMSELMRLPGSE